MGVQDLVVLELDRFEQRASQGLHDRALYLHFQMIGVDDCAALERFHDTNRANWAAGLGVDFGAGGHVATLLKSAGDAESISRGGLSLSPSGAIGSGLEERAHAFLFW